MTAPRTFALRRCRPSTTPICRPGIKTIDDLRNHLQVALELEHSTIPPYLCALYSIHDGANVTASKLIRSVVMEEMLHMVLAANLLNAIGGTPLVDDPAFIPEYPTFLPNSDDAFCVHLLPFGQEALEIFRRIEKPEKLSGTPHPDKYSTIGEFYAAIWQGFEYLAGTKDSKGAIGADALFVGDRTKQVHGDAWYYGGGGKPIEVFDMATARHAIDEITEQGEGYDHSLFDHDDQFGEANELAHYFRFTEIALERRFVSTDNPARAEPTGGVLLVDWSARYPMMPNPKAADFIDQPDVHAMMVAFNKQYTALLRALHEAFNGNPAALMGAVPIMYDLKYRAQALMAVPSGAADGTTVGPSFEYAP